MRNKINKKQQYKNYLLLALNNMEKLLLKFFLFLIVMLLISQIMLYYKIGSGYLNSVYKMEGNIFSTKTELNHTILCIHGDIPESDNIWVFKNGIPIDQIIVDTPVYMYVFEGDIIEIDATCASGIPREIFIKNITSNSVLELEELPNKIVLTDKLYRFQPLYSSS